MRRPTWVFSLVLFLLFMLLFSCDCGVLAQVATGIEQAGNAPERISPTASQGPQVLIDRGVVIEKIVHNGEAEKAGLQEGDILLTWSRGDSKGEIQSPFDLMSIETEQRPQGKVTLEGQRGGRKLSWTLGYGLWQFQVRPSFSGKLLSGYAEGWELAKTGKAEDTGKASERWKELAGRYSNSQPPWLSTWLLFRAVELLGNAKQWKEADDAYQAAIQSAPETSPIIGGLILESWAMAYQRRSDWVNAEKYLQQAIVKRDSSGGGQLAIALRLDTLGTISTQRGDLEKAQLSYHRSLEIRQKLAPGSLDVASSLNHLGLVAKERGDLTKAEEYLRQSLGIRERLAPGSLDVAASLNNLGVVALHRGELDNAAQYYRQALNIKEKLAPGSLDTASTLSNLGIVALKRGELAKAEDYGRQALTIQQELAPRSLNVAAVFQNLGNVAFDRGDLLKAEEYYHQALDIQEKLAPGSLYLAISLNNLGNVAVGRGDLVKAEEYHRQALRIRERLAPESLEVAASLGNLGFVARERGDLDDAAQYYRQALDIEQNLAPGSLAVAESLIDFGLLAFTQGELVKAAEYCQKALTIREKLAPDSLAVAEAIEDLGDIARKSRDFEKAGQSYRQALAIRENLAPGSKENAESLAAIASTLRDQGQFNTAAEYYAQAVSALEKQTARLGGSDDVRSGFRANHSSIYRDYVDLLVAQKQPERAFEVLERSRARTLLEMLLTAHIDIRKGADPSLLEQKRLVEASLAAKSDRRLRMLGDKNNEKQLAAFTQEIEELSRQHQEIEERLRLSSPDYAALTQPQPLTAGEIQRLLGPNTLLLEYSLGESRSYVWAISQTQVTSHEIPKRSDIEEEAQRVYELLTARSRRPKGETSAQRETRLAESDAAYRKAVEALSLMVLDPVAAEIQHKRLVVVSDGALQYIPFALLPVARSSGLRPAKIPLVAEHEVVNLPSASILTVLRRDAGERPKNLKRVAVLADPVFSKEDARARILSARLRQEGGTVATAALVSEDRLTRAAADVALSPGAGTHIARLPFTQQEALAIMATVLPEQRMAALGFDANLVKAMSPELARYQVVHFATHGLLDNQHPELAGLVFSLFDKNGKQQNGFLDLEDIYNLNLPVDLVVLSACETGLGKNIKGEGLVGLTRGFMYAGASRVVASLWRVDDVATSELMRRFYQAMFHEGLSPSAALRKAQLQMSEEERWQNPYYWAAFVLQGDWAKLP